MQSGEFDSPAKLAAEVLVAYLRGNAIAAADLPDLARRLREAFDGAPPVPARQLSATQLFPGATPEVDKPQEEPVPEAGPTPAVPIADSIHDDYLVSLEDGKQYRSLRRHLMAKYGMTPDDYRRKWSLPADYPMVAPSYSRDRSEVAKRTGLGRVPGPTRKLRAKHA